MSKLKQKLINICNFLKDPKTKFSSYYKNAWQLFLDSICVFLVFTLTFWYHDLPDDSLKREIYYNMGGGSYTLLLWVSIYHLFLAALEFKNNIKNIFIRDFLKLLMFGLTGIIGFVILFLIVISTVCELGIDCI